MSSSRKPQPQRPPGGGETPPRALRRTVSCVDRPQRTSSPAPRIVSTTATGCAVSMVMGMGEKHGHMPQGDHMSTPRAPADRPPTLRRTVSYVEAGRARPQSTNSFTTRISSTTATRSAVPVSMVKGEKSGAMPQGSRVPAETPQALRRTVSYIEAGRARPASCTPRRVSSSAATRRATVMLMGEKDGHTSTPHGDHASTARAPTDAPHQALSSIAPAASCTEGGRAMPNVSTPRRVSSSAATRRAVSMLMGEKDGHMMPQRDSISERRISISTGCALSAPSVSWGGDSNGTVLVGSDFASRTLLRVVFRTTTRMGFGCFSQSRTPEEDLKL